VDAVDLVNLEGTGNQSALVAPPAAATMSTAATATAPLPRPGRRTKKRPGGAISAGPPKDVYTRPWSIIASATLTKPAMLAPAT